MATVFLLALAAAVYPQLLAVVVVILTRPNPRPLLWACCLASLFVSVTFNLLIFAAFRSRETIGGNSSHRLGPAGYLVFGAIALLLAVAIATRRGRQLMARDLSLLRRRGAREPRASRTGRMKSKAEVALREGSLAVAVVVGAMLAVPGPFDLFALGHLARGGYPALAVGVAIVAFALIKFLLIEIPIVSFAVDPVGTSARVSRFSDWMHANKIAVIAVVVGAFAVLLIGRGISALA